MGDLKILLDALKGKDYSASVTRKEAKAQTSEVTWSRSRSREIPSNPACLTLAQILSRHQQPNPGFLPQPGTQQELGVTAAELN